MKPAAMTMDRIRDMDLAHGEEVRLLRRHIKLSTFDHEDNAIALLAMAQKLGVSFDELCSYVWLQTYIMELGGSYDDLPSPEDVAKLFGIDIVELENYLRDRAELLCDESIEEDPFFIDREIASRGFTPHEWRSYLEDLQSDALLQGD